MAVDKPLPFEGPIPSQVESVGSTGLVRLGLGLGLG
jgi:hypothetical protein